MTTKNHAHQLLHGAALSIALLLVAGPAALADPADQGLNRSTADYAAYVGILDRDLHNQAATTNEPTGCAQCAADLRATIWNQNNLAAR